MGDTEFACLVTYKELPIDQSNDMLEYELLKGRAPRSDVQFSLKHKSYSKLPVLS